MGGGEFDRDDTAHRVSGECGFLDAELVECRDDSIDMILRCIGDGFWFWCVAKTQQIQRDDAMFCVVDMLEYKLPTFVICPKPMKQHEWRAGAFVEFDGEEVGHIFSVAL